MKSLVQESVSDIMNPYVVTVSPYATLAEAYEIMQKNRIRRLPVVEDGKKLIGIVTLKDVLEAKPSDIKHTLPPEEAYRFLSTLTVAAAMTSRPVTIYQTSTIGNAAELMLDNKIGGLPVMDANDELAGLITESDIFRLIVKRWRDENYLASGAH
jgi:acetoin utilization protein AcuB